MTGNSREEPRRKEDVLRRQPGRGSQKRPQGRVEKADEHRQEAEAESPCGRPEAEGAAQGGDEDQRAEVIGRQGHGEDHGPHGG